MPRMRQLIENQRAKGRKWSGADEWQLASVVCFFTSFVSRLVCLCVFEQRRCLGRQGLKVSRATTSQDDAFTKKILIYIDLPERRKCKETKRQRKTNCT